MTETNEELYCIGCGAKIQSDDKNEPGYTPKAALQKGLETGELYCQRCFRLRHYNEVADVSLTDDDFLRLLNQLGQADALIVNVVDIFDFNGSLIPGLHRFVGDNPVLLVGNKEDLLPNIRRNPRLTYSVKYFAILSGSSISVRCYVEGYRPTGKASVKFRFRSGVDTVDLDTPTRASGSLVFE